MLYRYDYEECETDPAYVMMHHLETVIADKTFIGKTLTADGKSYTVAKADNFSYTDPIDGSVAKNQVSIPSITIFLNY